MFVPSLSVEHLFGADLAISFIHAFRIQSKFVASFDLRRVAEILLRLYTYLCTLRKPVSPVHVIEPV